MGSQLGVGCELDSVIGGFGGNGGGIGDDERDNEFAFVAHDHGIHDVRAGLECIFNGLRGDKFSRRSLDQVFLAIGDEEIVVFVQVADVTGAEPAIFAEHFAGGFGIFVVALHDAGALDKDFSVFGNADLHVGNRFTGTAHAIRGVVAGDDGRGCGQTVTLIG